MGLADVGIITAQILAADCLVVKWSGDVAQRRSKCTQARCLIPFRLTSFAWYFRYPSPPNSRQAPLLSRGLIYRGEVPAVTRYNWRILGEMLRERPTASLATLCKLCSICGDFHHLEWRRPVYAREVLSPPDAKGYLLRLGESSMGRGFFSKMLELERQSDKDNLKSNVQQFDSEPHESTLGTISSVKFICAGSTVSFWIWAIVPHSCRQLCLCSPSVQTVVGL